MLILASNTDKLRLITGSAGTIDVHASWMDNISGAIAPGRTNTPSITTATTTDIVGSPAAGVYRNIKTLHINNRGGAANTVTVLHSDGTTSVELHRQTLAPNETLSYIDEVGFVSPGGGSGGFTTGDAKLTLKAAADAGWVLMNDGTIGDASSGSTTRANPDTQALFALLFANITDAWAPILTSTGTATTRALQGTAAAAFAAHCRMTLPRQLGRALAIAGAGAGLSLRPLGAFVGEETHTQTLAELVTHQHTQSSQASTGGWQGGDPYAADTGTTMTGNAGSSSPMNVMQPTAFWNVMIKL